MGKDMLDGYSHNTGWGCIGYSFVTSRGHFEAETLNLLANTMLKIVLGSLHDRFAQVRHFNAGHAPPPKNIVPVNLALLSRI